MCRLGYARTTKLSTDVFSHTSEYGHYKIREKRSLLTDIATYPMAAIENEKATDIKKHFLNVYRSHILNCFSFHNAIRQQVFFLIASI